MKNSIVKSSSIRIKKVRGSSKINCTKKILQQQQTRETVGGNNK